MQIRIVCSLSSLYFSAKTKCKLHVKVKRVQVLESGADVAEVADYSFDVRSRAQVKLDVQSQKAQGHIYQSTTDSLTGASALLASAIHLVGVLMLWV